MMGDTPKKPKTFAERQAIYAEQARTKPGEGVTAKAKRATKSRVKRKTRPRRRPEPPPQPAYPCRIYFWQQVEGGPIRIGRAIAGNDQSLKAMRGAGSGRAFRLAVIPHANIEREAVIHQRFAHLKAEPGTSFYHPEAELVQFIATHAMEWEPTVKEPVSPREPKPKRPQVVVQVRACEQCGVKFESKEKDRFCSDCQKAMKEQWKEEGYLEKLPWRNPFVSRSEYGRGDDPDFENAIRSIEGD